MASDSKIVLFHCPQSRSTGSMVLLEELEAAYEVKLINIRNGENRRDEYLQVNPLGKVPALQHGDALITEQVAIFLYLADLFPQAGLAPALNDPLRGPYLRWMVYYASCFEPAVVDKAMQREPAPRDTSPYADYDLMLSGIVERIASGPYILGEKFSAADVLWGMAFHWCTQFGLVARTEVIDAYIKRVTSRRSFSEVLARDVEMAADLQAKTETSAD
ncbi:Glutathione S-transferase [Hahella chejuensis KCTC 2396]|uniref:Glutathione S-transferase n=1 Tax=Hahella chejuensis (strain KCTC 2396) TaxID=349521 RepID=Q2S7M3_HAHCH|nr:glutathione S-transferase family protein [Hahella chejuensis]ABC33351.1 Glutathione S-transferase [Hahella chejuensis KCTC 2396]